MKVYDNTPESRVLMKKTLNFKIEDPNSKPEFQNNRNVSEENQNLTCVDDTILREYTDDFFNEKDKNSLFKHVKELEYGESFGCNHYFTLNKVLKLLIIL